MAAFLALMVSLLPGASAQQAGDAATMVVCPACETTSLSEAIAVAPAGARIEVRGGTYAGEIRIEKPVALIGIDAPVIDGRGKGSAIRVVDADVTIDGFIVRRTGTSHDKEDSGIVVEGGRVTLTNNRIEDALFGIYVKQAPGSVIRNNAIFSKPVDLAMRGDGIKVWYCDDVVIEGNQASDGRDIILWYSNDGVIRDNVFDRGRYGLHLMFSDRTLIQGNSMRANSIGLYIMYSREPTVIGNSLSDNHGPSGGGIGLKDVDRAVIEANRFVNNNIAAQVDTSPRELGIENYWYDNVFAYNQMGIGFMPSVQHNTLVGNAFIDNTEHVGILGRGQLRNITWALDGRGNFWSDYAGYDADGDGIGDRPYRAQKLFESLTDDTPALRLFLFSPAATAIDFAAKAFPEVRPETKLEDPAPLMAAPASPFLPPLERASTGSRAALAIGGLAAMAVPALVVARLRPRPNRDGPRPRLLVAGRIAR